MAMPAPEQAQRQATAYLAGVAESLRGQALHVQTCVTLSPNPSAEVET